MRRRTLDLIFSVGGLLLALLLLVLGLVLQSEANFADEYVRSQLSQQKIVFTTADKLTEDERESSCLVANATQPLVTGKQAECYANDYIDLHLGEVNDGKTYAETSTESRAATTAAKDATESGAPNAEQLSTDAKALEGKTQTLFRGETLRGLLLTSYGFSVLGERAQQAALVMYAVALVLGLAAIAGVIHAFRTPKDETVEL
jgi:hypothetical protein